ncbi:MAG: extracellular solute-binding protein [Oscillospiraceae bacterium]|jgi:putative aldouronate transport system substrate-binding protein|nr:extracellular solute-binding protein [Oscillospiraceae bacterium]
MKRVLGLAVVLMMVASAALAAPSSQIVGEATIHKQSFGANLTQLPLTEEPATIVVWKGSPNSVVMETHDQCIAYEELEKRTGVHIEWVVPPLNSEKDNFNLRVASLDLPHMFVEVYDRYAGGLAKAIEDEIYLPLNSYYDDGLTPNYRYLRETYPDIAQDTVLDSGELAVFWQFDYVGSSPWSGFWVRQDWLDEQGLPLPVTVDDWTGALRSFKENYGATLGIQIGDLGSGGGDVADNHTVFSAYDVGYRWYQVDGEVKFGPVEPGFKQAVELLRDWYAEGLIDPNYGTYDWNGYTAKTSDAVSYGLYGSNYGEIGQMKRTSTAIDPDWQIVPINGPVSYEGQQLHLRQTDFITRSQYDAITTRAKDEGIDELIMQWKDYWYSQDGGDLFSYGVEGVSYEWDENGEIVWLYDQNFDTQDGALDFWTLYPLFKIHNGGYLRDSAAYIMDDLVWDCINEWAKITSDWFMPMVSRTADESVDYAALYTPINSFATEQMGLYISGQQSMDSWDSYVQTLWDMGAQDMIDIQQDALDRYLAR